MYSQVVILLDGSELAEGVLPHVLEIVRGRGSRVHLLSVAPLTRGVSASVADVRPTTIGAQDDGRCVERELEDYLRTVARKLEPVAAEVRINVRFGRPADEILTFVGDVEADLVAMSTHGRSGIGRWVFGSVANQVARGTTCPILLVRAGQVQSDIPYRRILVPLDGSELAEQIVPYVKALVRSNHTRVFLVSVLTTGVADRTIALLTSYPPGLQLATTALHHAEVQLQSYLRSVAAALREVGAVVHTTVRQGSPADEILAYADEIGADVISMTTHGFSGPSRWVYGNVAGKVLQGAYTPVLLVRPNFEQGGNGV